MVHDIFPDLDMKKLGKVLSVSIAVYILLYLIAVWVPTEVQGPTGFVLDLHFLLGMRFINVVLFGLTGLATYHLAMRFVEDQGYAFLASALVIISPLANHAIVAWTHVPVTFFSLLAYIFYLEFLDDGRMRWLAGVAVAAGLVFSMKYSDAIFLLPIPVHATLQIFRDRRYDIVRKSVVPAALLLLVLVPTLFFHASAFGSVFTTPYHMRPHALPPNDKPNIAVTFDPSRLSSTVPSMLFRFDAGMEMLQRDVEDFDYRQYKSALFQSSPALLLGIIGLALAWSRREDRDLPALAASGSALLTLLYGSWIYFSGGWTTNMRYLTPMIPVLAVFASYAVRELEPDWSQVRRLGVPAAAVSFLGLSGYALMLEPLAAKDMLNAVTFGTEIFLSAGFAAALWKGDDVFKRAFYVLLGVSVGMAGVMAVTLDNLMLFNGSAGTMLMFNADRSLFLGAVLAVTLAAGLLAVSGHLRRSYGGESIPWK
ncbi:MAG: ArnT family glycosyltransferase [Candidatus Nanohaloarchaea archaeon]